MTGMDRERMADAARPDEDERVIYGFDGDSGILYHLNFGKMVDSLAQKAQLRPNNSGYRSPVA